MKTLIKNLLLIVLFGTFTACEKTEVQTPSENTDLSITASIPSIDGLKSHVSHTPRMALYLDGVDDYIMVPDHPSLDMTTGFTVAAWVYMESYVEWASVVTKGGVPDELVVSENNYTLHQSGNTGGGTLPYDTEFGHLRFTNGCVTLPAPMPESVTLMSLRDWHYVTLTYDGSTLRFYLDGHPDGSHSLPGTLCTNDQPLNIGADFPGGNEFWHGAIDELRIWNIALTDSEVLDAAAGNARLQATNLVGYWHFNDGAGTTLTDYSGLGNHGTIMGGAVWLL